MMIKTPNIKLKCLCGCNQDAEYLCTGFDFDPSKVGNKGKKFVDEPCCHNAMLYLEERSYEMNLLPFSKRKII